jgi:hypothetical protein
MPADTTRRHFLLAVGGGTAAMLAATIPEPATTAPASPLDPGIRPNFRSPKRGCDR